MEKEERITLDKKGNTMNSDKIPTAGEWYWQLPAWRKTLFNVLCRIIGDTLAVEVSGYHRYIRKFEK